MISIKATNYNLNTIEQPNTTIKHSKNDLAKASSTLYTEKFNGKFIILFENFNETSIKLSICYFLEIDSEREYHFVLEFR